MKIKHMLLVWAASAWLMNGLVACKSQPDTRENATNGDSIAIHQVSQSGPSSDFTKSFAGSIAGKYPITMQLTAHGKTLSGSYAYKNVGVAINLTGSMDDSGAFMLQELDSKGQLTGEFSGKLTPDGKLLGQWRKPSSNKTLPFELQESGTDAAVQVTVHTFSVSGPNEAEADFSFPVVKGDLPASVLERINQQLTVERLTDFSEKEIKEEFQESGHGLTGSQFEVNLNQAPILAITVTTATLATYFSEATQRLTFHTGTGEQLSINQLLKAESLPIIARQCNKLVQERIQEAKRDTSEIDRGSLNELFADAKFDAEHLEDFMITKEGITFYYPFGFPHYALALEPDNAFYFSFDQLRPYIKSNGPLRSQKK